MAQQMLQEKTKGKGWQEGGTERRRLKMVSKLHMHSQCHPSDTYQENYQWAQLKQRVINAPGALRLKQG